MVLNVLSLSLCLSRHCISGYAFDSRLCSRQTTHTKLLTGSPVQFYCWRENYSKASYALVSYLMVFILLSRCGSS